MNYVPAHKNASTAATVAKWFNDIAATEKVIVLGVYGEIIVAEAAKTFTLADEDAANAFLTIDLQAIGRVSHTFPPGAVRLPMGKDIKGTTTGSTGAVTLCIVIGKET